VLFATFTREAFTRSSSPGTTPSTITGYRSPHTGVRAIAIAHPWWHSVDECSAEWPNVRLSKKCRIPPPARHSETTLFHGDCRRSTASLCVRIAGSRQEPRLSTLQMHGRSHARTVCTVGRTNERNISSICEGVKRLRRSIHHTRTAKKVAVK
jgi:hypothetical protein